MKSSSSSVKFIPPVDFLTSGTISVVSGTIRLSLSLFSADLAAGAGAGAGGVGRAVLGRVTEDRVCVSGSCLIKEGKTESSSGVERRRCLAGGR